PAARPSSYTRFETAWRKAQDLNLRGALAPASAWQAGPLPRGQPCFDAGGPGWERSIALHLMRAVLYRLSYRTFVVGASPGARTLTSGVRARHSASRVRDACAGVCGRNRTDDGRDHNPGLCH